MISDHYDPYSVTLNLLILGTFSTVTVMGTLDYVNDAIGRYGYSVGVICFVITVMMKAIELYFKIKRAKNGSNKN